MNYFGRGLTWTFWFILLFGIFLLYAPIFSILINAIYMKDSETGSMIWSLTPFFKALKNDSLMLPLFTSLRIAFLAALFSTLAAALLAFALQSASQKVLAKVQRFFYLPLMLPEIVIGLSLLIWFVFLNLKLGSLSLIIAHITYTLPYAIIIVCLGLSTLDSQLFEAAKDLGASQMRIFIHITVPLLLPSFLGSFFLCFVMSFDDFLISYFTAGVGQDTLPIKIYSLLRFGLSQEVKALSALTLMISFVISLLLVRSLKGGGNVRFLKNKKIRPLS